MVAECAATALGAQLSEQRGRGGVTVGIPEHHQSPPPFHNQRPEGTRPTVFLQGPYPYGFGMRFLTTFVCPLFVR
jgi:hypothetical protein